MQVSGRAVLNSVRARWGLALLLAAAPLEGAAGESTHLTGSVVDGSGAGVLPLFAQWAESEVAAAVAEETALRNVTAAGAAAEGPSPRSRPVAAR